MPSRSPSRAKRCGGHVRFRAAGALSGVLLATLVLSGCQKQAGETSSSSARVGAKSAAASGDACHLLDSSEVRAVFAGAKNGETDDSRKQYGITACTWSTPRGTFVIQFWESEGSSARDEASGLVEGVLDPLKGAAARNNVRYENVPGVGEQAVAVVETQDAQRGVLNDFAMLVARNGNHILVLIAPQLARSERTKALEGLQALGKSAVSRL
jgi:hypothetical protein